MFMFTQQATTRMRRLRFFLVIVFHIFVLSLLTETGILKKKTNTHAQLVFVLSLLTEIGILKNLTRMRSEFNDMYDTQSLISFRFIVAHSNWRPD